jgi:ferrous iron transport protein B
VVPITARSGVNVNELLHEAHKQMHMGFTLEPTTSIDDITHEIHHHIGELIHDAAYAAGIPAHWAAIKLLEGDTLVQKALKLSDESSRKVEELAREYENAHEMGDRETLIADSRYSYIEDVVGVAVKKGKAAGALSLSDKIDRIVTHRILAVPLFLLMMLIVFSVTFGPIGTWLSDGVDILINGYFASWVGALIQSSGAAAWIYSLVVDGIIAGVGGVLTFLPKIALLFLFLSLLEDSGYMARAALLWTALKALRAFGQGIHPDADGLWVHGAGRYGRAKQWKMKKTAA